MDRNVIIAIRWYRVGEIWAFSGILITKTQRKDKDLNSEGALVAVVGNLAHKVDAMIMKLGVK